MPPKGACLDVNGTEVQGKLCSKDSDCGLGASCNGNGVCTCMLSSQGDYVEGRIKMGGLCDNSNQCLPNLECRQTKYSEKACICPDGMFYNWTTQWCTCPDPTHIYDKNTQKCYLAKDLPRTVCSSKGAVCKDDKNVRLGESCDPVSHLAVCHAKDYPHSDIIFSGGLCSSNEQCVSNKCITMQNGLSYCE